MLHPDQPVHEEQDQPTYVELPLDLPAEGGQGGGVDAHMEEIPVPVEPINVDEEQEGNMEEEVVAVIEQPESEMTPSPTTPQSVEPPVVGHPQPVQEQTLGTALRRSPEQLDGHPMQPSPTTTWTFGDKS